MVVGAFTVTFSDLALQLLRAPSPLVSRAAPCVVGASAFWATW
jgi:hypothetical protein